MLPQTALAVVVFLLLITPGIVFELLRQTRRPAFEQTSLEEVARVVLASVGFSGLAITCLAVISNFETTVVLDLPLLAERGSGWYWSNHPGRVISTLALEVVVATGLALLTHRSLNHPGRQGIAGRTMKLSQQFLRHEVGEQVERFPLWRSFFRDLRPLGADTRVTVLTKGGTMITGTLAGYTANGHGDERDLAVAQPIELLRLGDDTIRRVPDEWPVMILSGAEVAEIYVSWPKKAGC